MNLKIYKDKIILEVLYKRSSRIIPAYAHDNVSANKLFKENIYL